MATGSDSRILAARAAAWERNPDALAGLLKEMDEAGEYGRSVEAMRASLHGALLALEGRADEAATLFRQARRSVADLKLPWLEALSAMDALYTLPSTHPERDEARETARRIFEALGATTMLTQVEALESGRPEATSRATLDAPAPDAVTSEAV
jgi:hypothetical protein